MAVPKVYSLIEKAWRQISDLRSDPTAVMIWSLCSVSRFTNLCFKMQADYDFQNSSALFSIELFLSLQLTGNSCLQCTHHFIPDLPSKASFDDQIDWLNTLNNSGVHLKYRRFFLPTYWELLEDKKTQHHHLWFPGNGHTHTDIPPAPQSFSDTRVRFHGVF